MTIAVTFSIDFVITLLGEIDVGHFWDVEGKPLKGPIWVH